MYQYIFFSADGVVVAAVHDAGVVEEDVELAEFVLGRLYHLLAGGGLGYVGVDVVSLAAVGGDHLHGFLPGAFLSE